MLTRCEMRLSARKDRKRDGAQVMTVIPRTLQHAVHNPTLSKGVSLKVYVELHESLNEVDFRAVKAWYLADLLHVDRSAVQYALKDLQEQGYLERGDLSGNCFTFRLATPSNKRSPSPESGPSMAA